MTIFGWIRDGFRQATVEGVKLGLQDIGLVSETATVKDVRQAITDGDHGEEEGAAGSRRKKGAAS